MSIFFATKYSGLLDYSFLLMKVAQPSNTLLTSTFHTVNQPTNTSQPRTTTNTSRQHQTPSVCYNTLKMALNAIESNPDVMNKLLAAIGVPETFKVI